MHRLGWNTSSEPCWVCYHRCHQNTALPDLWSHPYGWRFPLAASSQWLNMARILRQFHSEKIYDSSDVDLSLKNTRWPCQNFLGTALHFKMITLNFPSLPRSFTQGQTYHTIWQYQPLVAATSLTNTGVSPNKSLPYVILS